MPAYFAMGYLSWAIASVLIGKCDDGILGSELSLLPILLSFVMVMWDICIAPFRVTTSGFWVWHNGGVCFGVPFVNFLGWYLGVFIFYFVFALYLRSIRKGDNITHTISCPFWRVPILMYVSCIIEYWGNWLLRESDEVTDKAGHLWHTDDINGSLVLMSLFTMIFISFLGVVLIARDDANCSYE